MSDDSTVTLAEAGRRSHLSVATLRRWLKANKFPGATYSPEGWSIPVASLVETGAWPSATPPDPDSPDANTLAHLQTELARLRAALDTERTRREAADALRAAVERNADDLRAAVERNADDLRTALRIIEAGPQREQS